MRTREIQRAERICERDSIEVFEVSQAEIDAEGGDHFAADSGPGWYYWCCQPGCLPDSEGTGPFDSYNAALQDILDCEC